MEASPALRFTLHVKVSESVPVQDSASLTVHVDVHQVQNLQKETQAYLNTRFETQRLHKYMYNYYYTQAPGHT